MKRIVVVTVFILGFLTFAYAQQASEVKGSVYKKISSDRLANVLITNMRSHLIMMSDDRGNFKTAAIKGDTLLFNKTGFTPQKQAYEGFDMVVYLQPEVQLDQVIVRGQTKKQELNDIMGNYRSKGTFYNGKPPVLSFLSNPITGLYELFGKTPGQARRFAAFAKRESEETSVDSKYNKAFVMRVTGATDSVATKFMEYYRPLYTDVKGWSDYDLINNVKKAYEGYKKGGDKIKLEKLY
ncbi:hypothetical protein [Mucilaginibacter glaciei]|uniref:Carboxypeptidase-like protein n=1 Tax=Mucilaginibacter glaciei TaxID=2772109 RepID=A0A926S2G1_9SPHI|nr:hypothetical protein [Mucilaginibacter glaciei]MBD1394103.1 hypothetical protein [Mucilaginibacter glaciei]